MHAKYRETGRVQAQVVEARSVVEAPHEGSLFGHPRHFGNGI